MTPDRVCNGSAHGRCNAGYLPRRRSLPTALRSPERSLRSSASSRPTCSSTWQCWLQLWVSCTVIRDAVVTASASSAPTTNVQTRLDSTRLGCRCSFTIYSTDTTGRVGLADWRLVCALVAVKSNPVRSKSTATDRSSPPHHTIAHSLFHSMLKTFLFCKSFPLQPAFFFFGTYYMDSPDFYCYF